MEHSKSNNYKTSKTEINRRITAYTTLIVSFFVSLIIFSFNYIKVYPGISLFVLSSILIFLIFTRVITIKYFKSIINNKLILTSKYIERNEHKYLIKDIKKIYVKRTSKEYLREIKIIFITNKVIFINGIDHFEDFLKELQSYLSKDIIRKNIKEPIDFDHPTFYFFFGILVSYISIKFVNLLSSLNNNQMLIFYYIVSIYTIIMGLYFIIYKPIYKRDEKKSQITDYIWGIVFIISGILILLLR
jgi:hypothetical protein